ncbi:MAG: hypothetical protein ABJF11_17135 [Reichenbachiella sp.]|uniref:hypothetical protein n=1 Tax=Reichenbachiella sp. TaxID=2184521 RepID=UPI0032671E2F
MFKYQPTWVAALLLSTLTFFSCSNEEDNPRISLAKQEVHEEAKKCGIMHNKGLDAIYDDLIIADSNQKLNSMIEFQEVTFSAILKFALDNDIRIKNERVDVEKLSLEVNPSFRTFDFSTSSGRVLEDSITSDDIYSDEVIENLTEDQTSYLNQIFQAGITSESLLLYNEAIDNIVNEALLDLPVDDLSIILEAAYIGKNSGEYWEENLDAWHEMVIGMQLEDLVGNSPENGRELEDFSNMYRSIYQSNIYQRTSVLALSRSSQSKAWGKGVMIGGMDLAWGFGGAVFGGAGGALIGAIAGSGLTGILFAIEC